MEKISLQIFLSLYFIFQSASSLQGIKILGKNDTILRIYLVSFDKWLQVCNAVDDDYVIQYRQKQNRVFHISLCLFSSIVWIVAEQCLIVRGKRPLFEEGKRASRHTAVPHGPGN